MAKTVQHGGLPLDEGGITEEQRGAAKIVTMKRLTHSMVSTQR